VQNGLMTLIWQALFKIPNLNVLHKIRHFFLSWLN
jgi:hypothetical protein